MRGKHFAAVIGGAIVMCACSASAAFATGGATIAAAPVVSYGQQEFGNTATDSPSSDNLCAGSEQNSWWQLPVIAGDVITIDFEQPGALVETVYPVGTSDFNVAGANDAQRAELASNNAGQGILTAAQDGTMPLDFSTYDCDFGAFGTPGPYDFTAYVIHRLVLSLRVTGASRRSHRSSFSLQIHHPDGASVSDPTVSAAIQLQTHGHWVTVARAGAPFHFSIPWRRGLRGHWQSVRAVVSGPGYRTATSRAVRVRAV